MQAKNTIKAPVVGQKIYVGSSFYMSHGSDDFAGGRATISRVKKEGKGAWSIELKERPGHGYDYATLLEEQASLRKEYKGQKAHADPDIDTPWIEAGDTVDGKRYSGPSIP
jgi:hypothetical protein